MKNIIIYSSDASMCLSFLMYLQNDYNVTTTTDLYVLKMMTSCLDFDMIIIDTEPSKKIETFCQELRKTKTHVPIVLTYVYENQVKDFDKNIRRYANSIFYKPFDLNEVTKQLSALFV
ncbi:MAG: response regulator transcription factor [Ignavibacteriaceae bacterium]